MTLNGNMPPNPIHTTNFRNKPGAAGFVEVNCTPSVADGRIYLATRDEIYCIANKNAKPAATATTKKPAEAAPGPVAQLQIVPADIVAKPGETVTFTLRAFDANGVPVKAELAPVTWELPVPKTPPPRVTPPKEGEAPKEGPPAKAPAGPPALDGTIEDGKLVLSKKPSQHGLVIARMGMITAVARVRVAPSIPYKQDFEMIPIGAAGRLG